MKLNIYLPYSLEISLLAIFPRDMKTYELYQNVHSSFIALFIMAPTCKQHMSMNREVGGLKYVHIVESTE